MSEHAFDIFERDNWVVGKVLRAQARHRGAQPFVRFDDAAPMSYAEADARADAVAGGLRRLGVTPGERVAVFLPNRSEHCLAWFGISRAAAVHVAVNTEYKGSFLRHILADSAASVLVCDAAYLDRIAAIEQELPALTTLVVVGEGGQTFQRLEPVSFDSLCGDPGGVDDGASYREVGGIMYTSGTTGPSKGVLMPNAHNYLYGLGTVENLSLTASDVYYITLPLFHANGLLMQLYGTLIAGASAVVKGRFSASAWIGDIRDHGATLSNTLGVMNEFILNQAPDPRDREHRLRAVLAAPNTPTLEDSFRQRFGVAVVGVYGMTEVNIPLYTPPGVSRPGSCGREYSRYFQVRVIDPDSDEEQPRGQVGEIVVRPRQPFGFMAGYNGMPGKTVEAWRNFWFHTGDAATMDEEGYVYFVDRIKDCIRRRGENISSYEVESVILEHEAVAEVAAVAVASEIAGGEDEVKVAVVLEAGHALTEPELARFCSERMPAFAVPRYIELMDALPKTPTAKVRKTQLRETGVTDGTWDGNETG